MESRRICDFRAELIAPVLRRLEALEHARMPLTQYDLPAMAEELALARRSLERLADAVGSMAGMKVWRESKPTG